MTPADELMALAGKVIARGEFCADGGGVYGMDGDAICTTYSNAAHFQDRGEVAAFIAAACNFVRSDAFRAMVRDARRYVALRDALYRRDIEVGEAVIAMRVIGVCPDESEFDAAIDAAASGAGRGDGIDLV